MDNLQATQSYAYGIDSSSWDKNDIYYTLFKTSSSLADFNGFQPQTKLMTQNEPQALPKTGKFISTALRLSNAAEATLYMNGFNNVVVLPADTVILWNGNAMSSTTPKAYTKGSDVTIGFSDTNIKNITYLILNKDTSSYSVKMYFNTSAMARQAKDNWLTLGSGAPIIGLLESAIAYDVKDNPLVYTYSLTAAGATEGVNSTSWSNIGITNGYGISGNKTSNVVTCLLYTSPSPRD